MTTSLAFDVPRAYTPRSRLSSMLDAGSGTTAVIGPGGIGKSAAVAGWARDQGRPVAWVDASVHAAQPTLLWPAIAAVFDAPFEGSVGDRAITPIGDLVFALADALDKYVQGEHALVIDNFDQLGSEESAVALALFLRYRPQRIHVVVVSRRSLMSGAFYASEPIDVIDVDDLRFTVSESTELVRAIAPSHPDSYLDSIVTAADGWGVALALGAALRRHDGDDIVDPVVFDRAMSRYVLHDLLSSEDTDMVDFLIGMSVVDRVTAPLANAITGRDDGARMLELAEDHGLFLAQLGVRGWHEIHVAVRRALRNEAERRDHALVLARRRRAAEWLDEAGEITAALEQWIAAGDHSAALQVLSRRHIELYDAGLEGAIRDVVERLADQVSASDVGGMVDLAWCQVLVDRPAFLLAVEEASWLAHRHEDVDADALRRLAALRALAALVHGDLDGCTREARAALAGHPSWWNDPVVRSTWNDVARAIALAERWDESSDEVREVTVMLRRQPERSVVLDSTRALGEVLAGRPVDALRVAARARVSPVVDRLAFSRAELALAEVLARREIGDPGFAADELESIVEQDGGPATYARALAAHELVQFHLDLAAPVAAARSFERLERLVNDEFPGPAGRSLLGRAGTILALAERDSARAQRWADTVSDPFWSSVSSARVAATSGDRDRVRQLLDGALRSSPRHDVVSLLLRAEVSPGREQASQLAERSATIAQQHGMVQTVASAGQLDLIERVAGQLTEGWMDRLRRASALAPTRRDGQVVEPLTARELEVLRFLPSRLTLREIAGELYVSVNTLKFHLKVIYRKLGVNSRAEAAAVARSWGRITTR